MPVRIPPKNHRSVTGLVASAKNKTVRAHESTLERDLLFLLEFDLNVLTYEEQPVRIEFLDAEGGLTPTRRTCSSHTAGTSSRRS